MDLNGYDFDTRSKVPAPGLVIVIEESRAGEREVIRAIPTTNMLRTLESLEGDPLLRSSGPTRVRLLGCHATRDYEDARDIAA